MTYTIIVLVNATHSWLSLSRKQRDLFVEKELQPILKKYSDSCKINLFDCDFTSASVSDFLIVETDNLKEWGYLMGYLRESKTLALPYFEVKDILIGVPNNFRGSLNISDITS